tara:strand:+ start:311 stop:583 length:273 start_codon:yes stop_codon:yes gene_type:complete
MILPGTVFAHESGMHIHTDIPSTNIAFAETVMDKDVFAPGAQFDSKPLDEAQQEDQDLADIWTYSVIIVAGILVARIALQVVKKRMSRST